VVAIPAQRDRVRDPVVDRVAVDVVDLQRHVGPAAVATPAPVSREHSRPELRELAATREIADRYDVREAAIDPWRFGAQALDLSAAGLRIVQFPQHDSRLVPASERLSAAILERRLRHPGDPVLDAHVHAAVAKQTRRGAGSPTPAGGTPRTGSTRRSRWRWPSIGPRTSPNP
jgi:hypothetical protein